MTAPVVITESSSAAAAPVSDSPIVFPNGLVGQPDWRRFLLLTPEDDATIQVLQSVDDPNLALMVTNPIQIIPDFTITLTSEDRTTLDLSEDEQPTLLCTISIHNDLVTTNLVGPLVVNSRSRVGAQLVVVDSPYSTRHPIARLGQEG